MYDLTTLCWVICISGVPVGDITIGMTRPGGAGLYLQVFLKPKTKVEDGGSVKGPKPRGDLRPVEINRHMYMTCIVRQE